MMGLTRRQKELLDFIEHFIKTHHYSPSYREIMKHFGFSSPGTIYKHIERLKRKGYLSSEKKCSRSLTLESKEPPTETSTNIEVPFMGHISVDNRIEIFEKSQNISVPSFFVSQPDITYAVRAKDDSFYDELISEGDLILLEARQEVADGETIIASIEEDQMLIKQYSREGTYARLASKSIGSTPMVVEDDKLQIQGVIIALLRFYL